MKTPILPFAAALALALLSSSIARAETFQVFADSAGATKTNTIGKAAGKATTLAVSAKSSAFLDFKATNSGIAADSVRAARLVIFFPKVTKGGNITLKVNGTGFTETFTTKTIPTPTAAAEVLTFPVTTATTKNFVVLEVTAAVVAWLNGSAGDFGFALTGDATVNATIGSKEGTGSGYPAVLEVDVSELGGAIAGTTGTFSEAITGSTGTFAGAVSGSSGVFGGQVSGSSGSFSGAVSGSTGSFSAGVFGATGNFTGAVSGSTGSFSNGFSANNAVFSGPVGIGKANPSSLLDLAAAGGTQVMVTENGEQFAGYAQKNNFRSYFTGLLAGSSSWSVSDNALGDGGERLTVTSAGLVGIGTPTPADKLTVAGTTGTVISVRNTTVAGAGFTQRNGAAEYFTGLRANSDRWSVVDNSNAAAPIERLAISPTGAVGIGIALPTFALEVATAGETQVGITSTGGTGVKYSLQTSSLGGSGLGSFQIVDRTDGVARLMIGKNGNVGIGTSINSFPAAKLDVRGDIKLGASGQFFAASGEENLRIVRGHIAVGPGITTLAGQGFTVTRGASATGHFKVTFTTPFSGNCTPTVSPSGSNVCVSINTTATNSFEVIFANPLNGAVFIDTAFTFIAVGPR